jgi:signal transduction histidine kinase
MSMADTVALPAARVIGAGVELPRPPTGGGAFHPRADDDGGHDPYRWDMPREPLSIFGALAMTLIVVVTLVTEPRPDANPWVAVGVVALVAGIFVSLPRDVPRWRTVAGLLLVAAAACLLIRVQPDGIAFGALYYVVIMSALRLELVPALAVSGTAVAAGAAMVAQEADDPAGAVISIVLSVIPWFLIIRLLGEMHEGRERAEGLVEELRESRAAAAEAAAAAERGRVARELHDVLAHSLSALALQLEGTRLLARDRGADPAVVEAVERAHHLAAEGLEEARAAIGALRGDELPGPERLQQLATAFGDRCRLTVGGAPRELASEARLAIYRTAQEALTNVLRHSAADRVVMSLAYEDGGTRLLVQDHGPGAPVAVGARSPGGGYGLTGMRAR